MYANSKRILRDLFVASVVITSPVTEGEDDSKQSDEIKANLFVLFCVLI